jgi:hypothetical protein
MISYFVSFSWGIWILISLIGWGTAINRLLFPQHRVDWGQRAAWGIAWSVIFGGLLNVTWTISQAAILIYICSGALYGIIDAWRNKASLANKLNQLIKACQSNKFLAIGTFIAFLLAFSQYAGCVYSYTFSVVDDYQAYFVFPQKMLQLGSLGADPFSERRLVSSLGGQSFLQALSFSVLDERTGYLIDPGCALLVMLGLIIEYCQRKKISKTATVAIAIGLLSFNPVRANTSGVLIPVCLLFGLFNVLEGEILKTTNIPKNAAIVGLLAAAICALKSTLIPTCILFFTFSYFFYIIGTQTKHKAIYEFCLAAILLCLFVLPWSISLYNSSGTLLYPILGKGFHGSVYGGSVKLANSVIDPKAAIKLNLKLIFGILYILAVLGIRFWIIGISKKPIARETAVSNFISSVMGTAIIAFATASADSYRYAYPQLLVMYAVFILIIVENLEQNKLSIKFKKIAYLSAVVLSVLVAIKSHLYNDFSLYKETINNISLGVNNVPLVTLEEREKYAKMLDSVPQTSIVLTRLDNPFLMNFKKHTIWIADLPGGASLPPGMPSFKGEETLADYLVSHSIRYVAYSYANEANFPRKVLEPILIPSPNKWVENQALNAFEFQDSLQKLGKTRKRIYDDGQNFVIDLLSNKNQQ